MTVDQEKRVAAEAAAELVEDGMTVGLGTGTTVSYLVPALARRALAITCVATSPATERLAAELGIDVAPFAGPASPERLDIAIDGADQVDPFGWLIKGGGAAHTREKAVAAASDRFVVIVSADKMVERLTPPVPLELLGFGLNATLARLGPVKLRAVPVSPDGGIIADYTGDFDDPAAFASELSQAVGVVEHGFFPANMVSEVIVGRGERAERIEVTPPQPRRQ